MSRRVHLSLDPVALHFPKSIEFWSMYEDCLMADHTRSIFIFENPIGNGLNGFRATFTSICKGAGLSSSDRAVDQLKREGKAKNFLSCYFR